MSWPDTASRDTPKSMRTTWIRKLRRCKQGTSIRQQGTLNPTRYQSPNANMLGSLSHLKCSSKDLLLSISHFSISPRFNRDQSLSQCLLLFSSLLSQKMSTIHTEQCRPHNLANHHQPITNRGISLAKNPVLATHQPHHLTNLNTAPFQPPTSSSRHSRFSRICK